MIPSSTYRLQVTPEFDLDAAAGVVDYLRDLGVGWVYLSPLLQAAEGSLHGYDVVDPSRVDASRGGPEALDRFVRAARDAGLGILVDIVPNHMGIARPAENRWWWDVLTHGRASVHADAFDIDWEAGDGKVTLTFLGGELADVIGDIAIDATPAPDAPYGRARYWDHELPLAPGSLDGLDTSDTAAVLERQHWRPLYWRRETTDLNYRRFFVITSLAGVRVEVPDVFERTHSEILRWVREGLVDGLRIDHPDGLADPGGYLEDLARAAGSPYVLVEKILEHGEDLPAWWQADGTTGYDALGEIDRVLIDPAGQAALDALDDSLGGGDAYDEVVHTAKRAVADGALTPEIRRLVRALPTPVPGAEDALAELLTAYPVYRSYLPAGRAHLDHAAAEAVRRRPDLAEAIAALVPVLADPALEASRRFQQTAGPVMAKGVEDTTFYRYSRLGSLTEVGGDASEFAMAPGRFHRARQVRQSSWPATMTALTTHDTKRSEDVRARLDVLSELPDEWAALATELRSRVTTGDGRFDLLLWQAVIGTWPASRERLQEFALKSAREAALHTGWWDPDEEFEAGVRTLIDVACDDPAVRTAIDGFVSRIRPYGWANSLSAKLLQLAGPGVPDVYQGTELWTMTLVDPDNRRPVDFPERRRLLAELDEGAARGMLPGVDESGAAKLLLTARTLRMRRDRPDLFTRYTPMTVAGDAADHALAFDRGGALAVATRLPAGLAARGGWGDTVLLRHGGPTVDALTGRRFDGSTVRMADLLDRYPVALLVPEEAAG